jgi:hypothetical protein
MIPVGKEKDLVATLFLFFNQKNSAS